MRKLQVWLEEHSFKVRMQSWTQTRNQPLKPYLKTWTLSEQQSAAIQSAAAMLVCITALPMVYFSIIVRSIVIARILIRPTSAALLA